MDFIESLLTFALMPATIGYTELRLRVGSKESADKLDEKLSKDISTVKECIIQISTILEQNLSHSNEVHEDIKAQVNALAQRVHELETSR